MLHPTRSVLVAVLACVLVWWREPVTGQSDLDALMGQALERRDESWRHFQQYVLDEREEIDVRGPGRAAIWGERRDYTWYVRDGYFVRSPLRVNGAAVGEADRRKYEADFLKQEQEREKREAGGRNGGSPARDAPPGLDGFLRGGIQPQFIRAANFLRFQFEPGRYALVGRETLDGREVLRIEHYPARLFEDAERERRRGRERDREVDARTSAQIRRLLNKGSRITLWVDQPARQIVQYTFDNLDLDFFPAQWLASVTGMHATMAMGEAFPGVWLPRSLDLQGSFLLAAGVFELRYSLQYHDYRRADVTSTIRVPER